MTFYPITLECFASTLINNPAASVFLRGVRDACDDGTCVDAQPLALDFKRRELSDGPTLFQHRCAVGRLSWIFFRTYLLDPESPYILAGDETVVSKSGHSTYGLSRFFSSVYGRSVPGLAFFSLALVSVKERRSYPLVMEQIVRGDTAKGSQDTGDFSDPRSEKSPAPARKRGRPKGSRNRNKTDIEFSDTLKHIQNMLKALLKQIGGVIPVRYLVLDGPVWTQSGTTDDPPMWDVFDFKGAEHSCALFSTDSFVSGPRTSTCV